MDIEDFIIKAMSKIAGRNGNEKAISISSESMSAFNKSFICKQQLSFTKFLFKSANLHKKFKKKPSQDTYGALEKFFYQETKIAFISIRELIEEYFKVAHLNKNKPIISIGVFNEDTQGKTIEIITHSDSQLVRNRKTKQVNQYSCFEFIVNNGIPYHQNFIPKKIIKDTTHKHNDLDLNRARKMYKYRWFKDSRAISRRISIKKYLSEDKIWDDICTSHELSSLKSSIVVPITFNKWAEIIDDEKLKSLLFPDTGDRSILGCIIVEHKDTFFFDDKDPESQDDCDNIDINMLYMFADFISLYQVVQRNYTICSDTWKAFNGKGG